MIHEALHRVPSEEPDDVWQDTLQNVPPPGEQYLSLVQNSSPDAEEEIDVDAIHAYIESKKHAPDGVVVDGKPVESSSRGAHFTPVSSPPCLRVVESKSESDLNISPVSALKRLTREDFSPAAIYELRSPHLQRELAPSALEPEDNPDIPHVLGQKRLTREDFNPAAISKLRSPNLRKELAEQESLLAQNDFDIPPVLEQKRLTRKDFTPDAISKLRSPHMKRELAKKDDVIAPEPPPLRRITRADFPNPGEKNAVMPKLNFDQKPALEKKTFETGGFFKKLVPSFLKRMFSGGVTQ